MPLPTQPIAWPPTELAQVTPVLATWSAWWTGNPADLTAIYQRAAQTVDRPAQYRRGVGGALARFWWGRPVGDLGTQHRDQTHVPLAADIARTSADLLFAEPPAIHVDDATTQTRIEDALEEHLLAELAGAAETSAALGGVYLRVTWDPSVADYAFITAIPADQAVPEFAWGRLRAVTFWHVVAVDSGTYLRHLERHELDAAGNGLVQHGLYQGSANSLGVPVPLVDHPSTAPLAASIDQDGYVIAGRTPGLTVVYVPNTTPSTAKAWAHTPAAGGLGAADIDSVEPLLDNLDEVHASWLRDIRLAKARLVVARYMLDANGPGAGATFNMDTEVFAPLKMADREDGEAPITPVQFNIRFAEHQATAEHWTQQVIRSAGYSIATFGDQGDSAQTATEVVARQSRTMLTRGRKVRAWRVALRAIVTKLLLVDADVFKRPGDPTGLAVEFPDGISESQLQLAQTALALKTAGAASTRSLVALTHPDWPDDKVDTETADILAEQGAPAAADPFAIGT